jgi:chromosome segregation ATPase
MTTDPRALIAQGRKHDEAMHREEPACGCHDRNFVEAFEIHPDVGCPARQHRYAVLGAEVWCDAHHRELLDGYERALNEVDILTKERDLCKRMLGDAAPEFARLQAENAALIATQERLVARIAATDSPADIEATLATLEAARIEINRLTADRDHWREARRTAMGAGEVLKAENDRLRSEVLELDEQRSSYRDRAQQLATELGEAKLVIEQQDRDLERLRVLLADLRTPMNEDRIDAILQGAPCTDATKTK